MSLYVGPTLTGDQFLALRDIADRHEDARKVKIATLDRAIVVEVALGHTATEYLIERDGTILVPDDDAHEWVCAPDQLMRSVGGGR